MDETEFVGMRSLPKLKHEGCAIVIGPALELLPLPPPPKSIVRILWSLLAWLAGVIVEVTMPNSGPLITRSVCPN